MGMIRCMGGFIFSICFFCCMLFWDIILHFLWLISTPLARKYEFRKVGSYANTCFSLARVYTGMKIQYHPDLLRDLPPYFMVISNHQSFIDIAYLLFAFSGHRLLFVSKESVARGIPYASPLFRLCRHALVSRSGKTGKTMSELVRIAKMAPRGYIPAVFPEGTRSRTGDLGRFHPGAVRTILSEHPMPVAAVAVDGGYTVSGLSKLFRKMHEATYRMKVLKLYPPPQGKEDINDLLLNVKKDIQLQLQKWRGHADKYRQKIKKA